MSETLNKIYKLIDDFYATNQKKWDTFGEIVKMSKSLIKEYKINLYDSNGYELSYENENSIYFSDKRIYEVFEEELESNHIYFTLYDEPSKLDKLEDEILEQLDEILKDFPDVVENVEYSFFVDIYEPDEIKKLIYDNLDIFLLKSLDAKLKRASSMP